MAEAQQISRNFTPISVDEEGLETFSPMHCAVLFKRHVNWLEARLAEAFAGTTMAVPQFSLARGSIESYGAQCIDW